MLRVKSNVNEFSRAQLSASTNCGKQQYCLSFNNNVFLRMDVFYFFKAQSDKIFVLSL